MPSYAPIFNTEAQKYTRLTTADLTSAYVLAHVVRLMPIDYLAASSTATTSSSLATRALGANPSQSTRASITNQRPSSLPPTPLIESALPPFPIDCDCEFASHNAPPPRWLGQEGRQGWGRREERRCPPGRGQSSAPDLLTHPRHFSGPSR